MDLPHKQYADLGLEIWSNNGAVDDTPISWLCETDGSAVCQCRQFGSLPGSMWQPLRGSLQDKGWGNPASGPLGHTAPLVGTISCLMKELA